MRRVEKATKALDALKELAPQFVPDPFIDQEFILASGKPLF